MKDIPSELHSSASARSNPESDRQTSPDQLTRLANFLFEVGMLRKTPRSGYQFLGTGGENVAEHSYRTAVIAYALSSMAGADVLKTVVMALFHDLHETRIGDFNYVNRIYNSRNARLALEHALQDTGLDEIRLWREELEASQSLESLLVHDADQLDLILNLKQEQDLGNPYARKWLDCALPRLRTDLAKHLAETIARTDHTDWWFAGPDPSWWRQGHQQDVPSPESGEK